MTHRGSTYTVAANLVLCASVAELSLWQGILSAKTVIARLAYALNGKPSEIINTLKQKVPPKEYYSLGETSLC